MSKVEDVSGALPDDLRLLSAGSVAKLLSVSESHLCNMRDMPDEGGLSVTYVGSRRTPRYSVRSVREFIANGGTPVNRHEGALA